MNSGDSRTVTTQLLRETMERVDLVKSNLLRVGLGVLPEELQNRIAELQIDSSRLNRSAVIEVALMLLEKEMAK